MRLLAAPSVVACLTFGATLGCATSPTHQPDRPLIDAPAAAYDESRSPSPPPPSSSSLPEPSRVEPVAAPPASRAIARDELRRVLGESPALFLSHVDTEPAFANRRFVGWRLRAFFPGDPRLDTGELRPGDVIVRVNGRSVERPEQFIDAWHEAGARKDLVVELLRDGRPQTLTWPIVDR